MYTKKISNLTAVEEKRQPKFIKPYFQKATTLLLQSQKSQKDYSDGLTYFETYPQNQHERQFYTSMQYDHEQSECPSIENGIIDNFLEDLKQEIRLKSQTLSKAETIIQILKQDVNRLSKEKVGIEKKLQSALSKINQLQSELEMMRLSKTQQSGTKKSITKTYITQKNIVIEQPTHLQLISSQIFNQFAIAYSQLKNELAQWAQKQRQQQLDSAFLSRIEMYKGEVDDILYGKSDEQYSKTTLSTFQNESNKKGYNYESPNSSSPSSYNEYEQAIDMYKEHCNKLSVLLCESTNCIQQLSNSLERAHRACAKMAQPHALLPKDLIRIVVKQCNRIASRKFVQLKMENVQLNNIINQMIQWIQKNSKDGAYIFKSFSSATH